jgi:glycosyltransferase involved in cell wall biosynthesis
MSGRRVVVVGPLAFPNPQGGMTRHCEELYARLAARGWDVTVLCRSSAAVVDGRYRGMRVRRVPGIPLPGWDRLGHSLLAAFMAAVGRFDVVHFHALTSSGFCFLPRLTGKRVVVTVHRLEWQDDKWGPATRAFLRWSERCVARSANAVITVSQTFADELRLRHRRLPPVQYVANGVLRPADGGTSLLDELGLVSGRYFVIVGRVVPEKGIDVALDAWDALADDPVLAGQQLVIVGGARHEGAYVRAVEERAAASGGRVRFLGIRTGAALGSLFRHARALIAPSFHEGQPLTVLEAMSIGLPVIASDIDAHRELLGADAVIVAAGESGALADAIRALATDPTAARSLGERGRARLATGPYSWDEAADATEAVLRSV